MSLITKQSDNSEISSQPEYLKKYKPENNHGCCPSCSKPVLPVCTTVIQAFTRSSQDESLVISIDNTFCRCQGKAPISGCCND